MFLEAQSTLGLSIYSRISFVYVVTAMCQNNIKTQHNSLDKIMCTLYG